MTGSTMRIHEMLHDPRNKSNTVKALQSLGMLNVSVALWVQVISGSMVR